MKLKKENLIAGWKVILKYLRPHKRDVFVLSFLVVISALSSAAVPYLAGKIIDNIFSQKVFNFILLWSVLRILGAAADWRTEMISDKLDGELEGEFVVNGYSTLLTLPMSFHKSNKIGEMANRIGRASGWLSGIVTNVIINLSPQFISILFALFFTFYVNIYLASILILGVLIYSFAMLRITPKLAEISSKMHKAYSEAYGNAHDVVLNVHSVKQAAAENYENKKMHSNFLAKAFKLYFNMQKLGNSLSALQKTLVILVQFSVFIISVFFIQKNHMTIGQLVMFNGYAAMFFGPFVALGNNWRVVQNGIAALERAEKVTNLPSEKYFPENAIILGKINGEVEFQNVTFGYGKKYGDILKNISFKTIPGEKIAFVGESGVGKSSLVDLISYYYKPKSGKILIDGHNVANLDLKFLRGNIAVVPQEIILFNDTVKNNIRYGSFGARDEAIKDAARLAHADEFIENFPKKYDQIVGERGIKLSSGQKQRIALARAFLRNPKILILDEPTSALDSKSEQFIQESLKTLMKGRTTFIIAHRLSTVREVDRILVLEKGEIAESGRHEELLKIPNGIYRKLYELQVGLK